MEEYEIDSTEMDTEYDIIDELTDTLEEIEKTCKNSERKIIMERISFMKFLLKELGDSLSGEYEELRRRRFIIKKTV
jgi:hypothetical protein